jgi:predicted lactoylglutathione lyase
MITNNPQPIEITHKPIVKKNPLFDEPQIAEDETFVGEKVQVASMLGKAFIQPLKQKMDEVPQVVQKAKETDMGEEAIARSEEFLERHELPATELPEKAVNINLKYLEAPEQVNRTIDEIATMMPEQVEAARGGVQTWDQTQKLAGELGMTVDDLLERKQGDAWNAQSIYAARTMLATARDSVDALANKINSEGGATPEEMVEFRQMLGVYAGIQQQMHGLAAEAGRALNQFRIVAKSGDLKKQEIQNILDTSGAGATERMASMWGSLDDPAQKAKFAKKAHSATGMDMVLEYWINALLSAPSTHAVNIMGNSLTAMWSIPEKAAARGISMLLRDEAIAPSETTAMAFGLYKGSMDGLKLAWQVLKTREPVDPLQKIEMSKHQAITGENVENLINKGIKTGGRAANWMMRKDVISPEDIEASGWIGRGADALGTVIRMPGLALMAEDEFFKSIAYRMELTSLAAREAFQEGLTGADAAVRISQILDAPPETMHVSAMDASHYKTFTNK